MKDAAPPSLLARGVAYAPTALLITVALVQIWCAVGNGRLTPAKGGGFGLFSTVDKLNNRHMRAYVQSALTGQETPLTIPNAVLNEFRMQAWSVKAFPTDARLRSFVRRIDDPTSRAPEDLVRIGVVKMTFDAPSNEARFVPVADIVYAGARE